MYYFSDIFEKYIAQPAFILPPDMKAFDGLEPIFDDAR